MKTQWFDFYYQNKSIIQRLSKESGWIVAGQAVSILGAIAIVRMLTEYLDPAEYGQLALGLTVGGLLNQVVMGGLSSGIGRYYLIAREKSDLPNYFKACKRLLGYATVVALLIAAFTLFILVLAELTDWIPLALTVFIFSIFAGYSSVFSGIQNAERQRAVVAIHGGVDAWLKLCLAAACIFWLGNSGTSVVLGYLLSVIIVTLSQFFFLNRLIRQPTLSLIGDTKQDWLSKIWSFSWPFSAFGIFTWLQQASDRWAIQIFGLPSDVGLYAVVYQLGFVPMGLLLGLVPSLASPILYRMAGDASEATRNDQVHILLWRVVLSGLLITVSSFGVSWLVHEWLFHWLVSEMYRDASVYLPWVVMAGGLFSVGQILSLKLMSELRSRDLLYAKIGSAVFGIMTNILGAWLYGVAGVVLSLLIFSALFFFWILILTGNLPKQLREIQNNGSI